MCARDPPGHIHWWSTLTRRKIARSPAMHVCAHVCTHALTRSPSRSTTGSIQCEKNARTTSNMTHVPSRKDQHLCSKHACTCLRTCLSKPAEYTALLICLPCLQATGLALEQCWHPSSVGTSVVWPERAHTHKNVRFEPPLGSAAAAPTSLRLGGVAGFR